MTSEHKRSSFRERLNSFRSRQSRVGETGSMRGTDIHLNGAVYYTFSAYLFVTTIILSDAHIFTADTGFTLPIISLNVPFLGFFVLAPLALLILHAHALGNANASTLQPNGASQTHTPKDQGKASELFFFLFSPTTLTVVFWRLADYQSVNISLLHATLVGVDLWLTWQATSALGIRLRSTRTIKKLIITIVAVAMIKAVVCWDVFVRPWPSSIVRQLVFNHEYFVNEEDQVEDPLGLIPNINVDRTVLLVDIDAAEMSSIAALHGYESWRDYFDDRGVSVDIRDRSLRLAYLHGQTLPRVWAHNAQLQGSNLSFAFMPGAVLVQANLQDAYLELTNLNGAYLDGAILRDSSLIMTIFRGASLDNTQLQGAHIRQADFTAAWMPNARFELSPIIGANFSGAYIDRARFWGSLYVGPPQFVASTLEDQQSLNMSAPTNEELGSWRLSSPVKKVSDLKGEGAPPLLSPSDAHSIDSWVETFCTDPLHSGNEAAVKLALRIYSLAQHPLHAAFSQELRNDKSCAPLLKAIAEDRSYLSKAPVP